MPFKASFTFLEPLELAVLDGDVANILCRWPSVTRNLMTRLMERSRHMAGHLTLTQFPRVENRLHVVLWHLAERFGRMTRDGVVVRVPLTHELLGGMVAARRPSVTATLGRLEDQGLVIERDDRSGCCASGPRRWAARARRWRWRLTSSSYPSAPRHT